ncbi:MAG: type 4a pilus biogenesis protein PilO [Candidatus Omnitrophota bacterium]
MKINFKALTNLNIREKVIIVFIVTFVFGFILYSVLIKPIMYHHKLSHRHLNVQKNVLKSREDKLQSLSRLKDSFERVKNEVLTNRSKFFTEEEALNFLNGLESWAEETKTDIEKIRPKSERIVYNLEAIGVRYKKTEVEIFVTGKFNCILNVFKSIAKYNKLLAVREVDIKHMETDPSVLNVKFNLYLYVILSK